MWPIKTILYFLLFWLACFASLVNPIWGVVNYMIAYQTNPTNTWWGEPLESLGMRFSLLASIFLLIGLVTGRRKVPGAMPTFSAWEGCIFAVMACVLLNIVLGATYDHRSVMAIDKLWKMLLFVLVLGRMASSRRNMHLVFWSLVIGSMYVGYDAYSAGRSDFFEGRLNRIGGPDFSTSSGTAAHISAMLPLMGTVFLTSPGWMAKAIATLSAGFAVNAIVLCRTRSAFIGMFVGALVALLLAPRTRRFRIYVLFLIGGAMAYSLTDDHFWDRMKTLTNRDAMSTDLAAVSRTEIWKVSFKIMGDYPLGIGAGNFARVITWYEPRYAKRSTHNTVLVCFVELGIQGGLLFLTMFGLSLKYLFQCYRLAPFSRNPQETVLMAYGLLVSCVTYFVTGLGTERFYCESFWWVLVLPVSLYRIVTAEAMECGRIAPAPDAIDDFSLTVPQDDPETDRHSPRGAFA
ncbi:MAG: O-antigen ligase family protein [Planctomycetota bacterium]